MAKVVGRVHEETFYKSVLMERCVSRFDCETAPVTSHLRITCIRECDGD